ncbi:hypothetical protein FQA39_LY14443 [Lamprigera yunnana]|nr:hypothetical protein FQA39_LY14443 [Lamprigera yunnana]
MEMDLEGTLKELENTKVEWRKFSGDGLDLDYSLFFQKTVADKIMAQLENDVEYYEGDLTKVKIFGKWHSIPRQQVSYGDRGLKYTFSGVTLPAKNWIPILKHIRDLVAKLTKVEYNFVLVNRYRNGHDHIGEHRDGEADLDPNAPIASVSFGQHRDFILKHGDCRKVGPEKRNVPRVKLELEHGSLLIMNPPTNKECLCFTPCGNYLIVGDVYGKITVFHLYRIMNPDANVTGGEFSSQNSFTVQEDIQINSLLATECCLIVGVVGEIYGYDWKVVKNSKEAKVLWKIELPNSNDAFNKAEINSMVSKDGVLYAGCGDNKIYMINLEGGHILRTLSGHSDYIHSLFNVGNDLASGGEDGVVNIWDIRAKQVSNKIEPHTNDDIARPNLGKWIGSVCINDDWLLCGGGPKLSLWHFRSLTASTIFPLDDKGIHFSEFVNDKILAGGRANHFYNMVFNGEIVSQIPTSCVSVFAAVHQEDPYRMLCIAGSSPKIDICSNFNYKDQVLTVA